MPDEIRKDDDPKDPAAPDDGAFKVDVPDDLLEEAVHAVDKRVEEGKQERHDEDPAAMQQDEPAAAEATDEKPPVETSVEIPLGIETSVPEAAAASALDSTEPGPDLSQMSLDDLIAGGYLPDQVITALNENRQKMIEAKAEAASTRDKMNAMTAEGDAFRKRLTREKNDAVKFANEGVIKEFLPVVDNLERALAHASPDEPAHSAIRDGVEITVRQLQHILTKFGVTRVDSKVGTTFDPRFHEAVQQEERDDVAPGAISIELQAGWLMHERLLRPAMVAVAKAGASKPAAAAKAPARAHAEEEPSILPPPTPAEMEIERNTDSELEDRLKSIQVDADGGAPATKESVAPPEEAPKKPGVPVPSFEDSDLDSWESTVDSARTDGSSGGRRGG